MMCYVECEHHGPQVGSRGDYPYKELPRPLPKGYCPECGADLSYAMYNRIITEQQLTELPDDERAELLRNKVFGKRPAETV
jgi:hypothetical protein